MRGWETKPMLPTVLLAEQRIAVDLMGQGEKLPLIKLWMQDVILYSLMERAICTSQVNAEKYCGIWQTFLDFIVTAEFLSQREWRIYFDKWVWDNYTFLCMVWNVADILPSPMLHTWSVKGLGYLLYFPIVLKIVSISVTFKSHTYILF